MKESEIRAGRRPVLEALKAGLPINRIWMARGAQEGSIRDIRQLARESGVPLVEVNKIKLDHLAPDQNHQGVVASLLPRAYVEVDDLLQLAREKGVPPWLVALDGIEDPHNLGAILRTAEAVGVQGVILTKRRSAQLNSTVVKASAGAADLIPTARVSNLVQTLEYLKEQGCWIVGLAPTADQTYLQIDYKGGLVVVIGGEGKGLNQLTMKTCDHLAALPMKGQMGSLNASVAAGIVLYEALRQREGSSQTQNGK